MIMVAKAEDICCTKIMDLDKKVAVMDERFDNLIAEMAANTASIRDLTASISDYPITRERVGNMWKMFCGLITLLLLALAASWGLR
jgi:hypothetical protein